MQTAKQVAAYECMQNYKCSTMEFPFQSRVQRFSMRARISPVRVFVEF